MTAPYTPTDRAAAAALVDAARPNADTEWKRLFQDHYIGLGMPFARFQREQREHRAMKQVAPVVADIAQAIADLVNRAGQHRTLGRAA